MKRAFWVKVIRDTRVWGPDACTICGVKSLETNLHRVTGP